MSQVKSVKQPPLAIVCPYCISSTPFSVLTNGLANMYWTLKSRDWYFKGSLYLNKREAIIDQWEEESVCKGQVDGENLEVVKKLKYLAVILGNRKYCEKEVEK